MIRMRVPWKDHTWTEEYTYHGSFILDEGVDPYSRIQPTHEEWDIAHYDCQYMDEYLFWATNCLPYHLLLDGFGVHWNMYPVRQPSISFLQTSPMKIDVKLPTPFAIPSDIYLMAFPTLLLAWLALKFEFAAIHSIRSREGPIPSAPDTLVWRDRGVVWNIVFTGGESNVPGPLYLATPSWKYDIKKIRERPKVGTKEDAKPIKRRVGPRLPPPLGRCPRVRHNYKIQLSWHMRWSTCLSIPSIPSVSIGDTYKISKAIADKASPPDPYGLPLRTRWNEPVNEVGLGWHLGLLIPQPEEGTCSLTSTVRTSTTKHKYTMFKGTLNISPSPNIYALPFSKSLRVKSNMKKTKLPAQFYFVQ